MYADLEKNNNLLRVSLTRADALMIIAGQTVNGTTERLLGRLTIHVLPRQGEVFNENLPVGDPGHLANLRGRTSGVRVNEDEVKIWLSRTLLASNAIASEVTDRISSDQPQTDINQVHIVIADLEQ